MTNKLNLGILFGGRSCEHEVSVTSASSILKAIDTDKYHVHLIGIDKSGHWHLGDRIEHLVEQGSVKNLSNCPTQGTSDSTVISIGLHNRGNLTAQSNKYNPSIPELDLIFPVLHGTFGEDGTVQGVLEMAGIPYVGCAVAASALAMDKALAKKVFESSGIPQAKYSVVTQIQWSDNPVQILKETEAELGFPVFVKPANLGSSVGVGKAYDNDDLTNCIHNALQFDTKIIIEESMENCHEVECAVLGNEKPEASILGEIVPGDEFYSYETKYIDDKSELVIPAPLDDSTTKQVQDLSINAFKAIDGSGLARVDFFVNKDTMEITLNEVNTMPGFTPISMYPQLWAASGVAYPELIDRLVELAIQRHQSRISLKRAF